MDTTNGQREKHERREIMIILRLVCFIERDLPDLG